MPPRPDLHLKEFIKMHNLLPHNERQVVKREAFLRKVAVCEGLAFFVFFIAIVFLLPAFFYSSIRDKFLATEQTEAKKESELEGGDIGTELARAEKQARLILAEKAAVSHTDLVNTISKLSPAGVRIVSFVFNKEDGGRVPTVISGIASTRDALVKFENNLKGSDQFESVLLPIGVFAEESDLSFTITFSYKII